MIRKPRIVISLLATLSLAITPQVFAQDNDSAAARALLNHLSGTFNDYVWVEGSGAGAGAWHVTGEWVARVRGDGAKGDFTASLLGVRSDLWVLTTFADAADPALRMPHTHHVGLADADVTVIPDGIRLQGIATITANGSVALYSGSTVRVDITGGSLIQYSNIKLTFLGAAVGHFGPQPYEGLVVLGR
jgi:hypothetical protein